LKLVARLLETELPLGELMALQPGAVIPVSLGATEVLVDGERLFTASVAEHQGKLCLTSFADAD
ncbi:FliM/FliN family flagellar motor switch protein, partial [Pelomonas sp. KK5]|uniref:FliM/FliN family flagellar motor switch protein n=1 Tax=Pelomonas sp. KK5 TaxID=1855730 RepID=UPI00117E77BC